MKAKVDTEICTGCGLCVDTCPDMFDMDEDVAIIKVDPVPADAENSCLDATEECPV